MRKKVVISIEGKDKYKVLFANKRGGAYFVDEIKAFDIDQLKDFLNEKDHDNFIIISLFDDFNLDIINIPPVKGKFVTPLLESEVRKLHPNKTLFSNTFFFLGETADPGMSQHKYAVFTILRSQIDEIIKLFTSKGKNISSLYHNISTIPFLLSDAKSTSLLLIETDEQKHIILIENNNVIFARSYPSIEEGLADYDIQNLDMTINYCKQNLKVLPENIIVAGFREGGFKATVPLIAPLPPMLALGIPEMMTGVDGETFNENIMAISALCAGKGVMPSGGKVDINLLTKEYKVFRRLKSYFRYISFLFLLLSLVLIVYCGIKGTYIINEKKKTEQMRELRSDISEAIETNKQLSSLMKDHSKILDFLTEISKDINPKDFLTDFSKIDTEGLVFDFFDWISHKGGAVAEINGLVETDGFYGMQERVKTLEQQLYGIKGVNLIVSEFDLSRKWFNMVIIFVSADEEEDIESIKEELLESYEKRKQRNIRSIEKSKDRGKSQFSDAFKELKKMKEIDPSDKLDDLMKKIME